MLQNYAFLVQHSTKLTMRYIFLFLLFCFACAKLPAQETYNNDDSKIEFVKAAAEKVALRSYDSTKLAEYRQEKRFQYDKVKQKQATPNWLKQFFQSIGKWLTAVVPSSKTMNTVGNAVVYGIALLAFALIVWGIFKMRIRNVIAKSAEPLNFDFKEVTTDILMTDFEKYLNEAVRTGNYKKAVQLLYLESLKSLTLNNIIQWKPTKTNQEYLYEMQNSPLRRPFMDITRMFEYIFYGEFPINEQTYLQTAAAFQDFQGKIGQRK